MANSKFFLGLLLGDFAVIALHYFFADSLGFFNIEKERSLSTVYGGLKALWSGVFAFAFAWLVAQKRARARRALWIAGGALFTYFALDDMMEIHERVGFVLNRRVGLSGYWGESFNWIIYFAPFLIVGLVIIFYLVREIWRADRTAGAWSAAGLALLCASLALEGVGGQLLGSTFYRATLLLEEAFELIAMSFLLAGLARFWYGLFTQLSSRPERMQ